MVTASHLRTGLRAIPLLVCAVLAFQVVQVGTSGLMLRNNPERALAMWPGSAAAASQSGENLVRSGKIDQGQALAVRALAISAQDSQALHTLAAIGRARGNLAITDAALTIAAHLGWRDVLVQRWVLERALKQNDPVSISRSADALLRSGSDPQAPFAALRHLLTTPEGRVALAERLSGRPAWGEPFLDRFRAVSASDSADFGALLVELKGDGALPPDKFVQGFFQDLVARGRFAEARSVWQSVAGVSGDDAGGDIFDGGFEEFARQGAVWGPFGWRAADVSHASVAGEPRSEFSRDMVLKAETFPGPAVELLSQLISLRPGRYTLSYEANQGSGPRHAFRWVIRCLQKDGASPLRAPVVSRRGAAWNVESLSFQVPETGCPGQLLALAASGANEAASVSIDSVRIKPE